MRRILVTGGTGQIGSELVPALRRRYGAERVVAAGHKRPPGSTLAEGPYLTLDVTDRAAVRQAVGDLEGGTIYHLAALLSATAEADPKRAWEVNMGGLVNLLEGAREFGSPLFFPSSIGAFGPTTPRDHTPQETIQRPATLYGITKLSGELLCDYYFRRYGVDARGLRFPGLISHVTPPGGGTTDYAVEIFHAALKEGRYTCFLEGKTRLDMMYMPDAVRAAMELMEADPARLKHRNAYNVTAMSITPEELAAEIGRHLPGFTVHYLIDPLRQGIADGWPRSLDDGCARAEWGWRPAFDLPAMVTEMLRALPKKEGDGHAA